MGRPKKDLSGLEINGKKIIRLDSVRNGRTYWLVRCSCGNLHITLFNSVKRSRGCEKCAYKGPRLNRRKRPFEAHYNTFVNRAKYPVKITYNQFLKLTETKECHYCGCPIMWQEYRHSQIRGGSGSNLDRKNNNKPYNISNVVVCCGRCNYAKGSHFTYDEWKDIGNLIRTWGYLRDYKITPQTRINKNKLALLQKDLEKEESNPVMRQIQNSDWAIRESKFLGELDDYLKKLIKESKNGTTR